MKIFNTYARSMLVTISCLAFISLAHGQGKGRLKAEFNEELTPLQSAIADSVSERRGNGKAHPALTLKCANPNSNNPKCEVMDEPCRDCGEITNRQGMVVGRKNRSKTIINYSSPAQRKDNMVKFDRIKVGSRNSAEMGAGPNSPWASLTMPIDRDELKNFSIRDAAAAIGGRTGEMSLIQTKMRRSRSGLSEPINNDLDCIDTVTREWANRDGCFENGVLLTTMEELFEENSAGNFVGTGCEHIATGEIFAEDPDDGNAGTCYDKFGVFKGTSLEELIDEDGPDFAEKIDQDGDGAFDEDPSESSDIIASCQAFYEEENLEFNETMDVVDDQCDLSRAFMVKFNHKLAANPKNTDGSLAYLVDDQGWPIDADTAKKDSRYQHARAFGENRRRVTLWEDFSIKCKGNEELLDGECVNRLSNDSLVKFAFSKAMAAGESSFDRDQKTPMLMGFTFAPPVIKWGHTIEEEVCVDLPLIGEVCAEVFYARIGYEFDIAAGLRLPIQLELTELPPTTAPGILAESSPVIRTSLEPADFTVGQFKAICIDNNLSTDCTRFAFPEFIDSFNPDKSADEKDGSELVGRETIFAGVQVRVLTRSVVDWAIDSNVDIIAMCSMLQVKEVIERGDPLETQGATLLDVARIGTSLAIGNPTELLAKLKKYNCASFTTPYGSDGDKLRTLPFINERFDIGASCTTAIANGEVINVNGKLYPFCTGLEMGVAGAKVGIGLGIEARLGSTRIDANWWAGGDAMANHSNKLIYNHNVGDSEADVLDIQLEVDNFQGDEFKDMAKIELNDFVYYANAFNLRLTANLQFGGILFLIPDTPSFTLFDLVLTGDNIGIPIGQHSGMDPVTAEFFVENYALTLDGKPADSDPARADENTLLIKPGVAGIYQLRVNNRGSVFGDFDNFRVAMSNQPDQSEPYTFVINPNTDLDCVDGDSNHFFGNPYDGVGDDCYTVDGMVRSDRTELIDEDGPCLEGQPCLNRDDDGDGLADEDPVDNWQAAFEGSLIASVDAYQESDEFLALSVTPFRHPLTRPGIYPVQILADSHEATVYGLNAVDPAGQTRVNAEDVVLIKVDSFYDPLIAAQPLVESGKSGIGKTYTVEISNGSNVDDSIDVDTRRVDFNLVKCSLTTLGSSTECPFRATPTAIKLGWTNGELPTPVGPLLPLGMVSHQFTLDVPSDWAGMEDTTYQLVFTATSTADPEDPPASNKVLIEQTVTATMESMTRYIGLELLELIAVLDQAEADGIATKGLKPISVQAVQRTNNRALGSIQAGNLSGSARIHAANIKIMGGFTRALAGSGKSLPESLLDDLNARATAIIADMTKAQTSPIPSA